MRWTLVLLVAIGLFASATGVAAAAGPPPGTDPQLVRDHDRAIEIALDDPYIQDRLALRPGLEVRAGLIDFTKSPEKADRHYGLAWLVGWYEPGADNEDTTLSAVVNLEEGVLQTGGLGLIVMPGRTKVVETWIGSPWAWGSMCAAFLLCVAGAFRRGAGARMLVPLVLVSAAFVVTLLNVVPRSAVREGNVALFGAAAVGLAVGAWIWARTPGRSDEPFAPRWPTAVWALTWLGGMALQLRGALRVEEPIDVAAATDAGARLVLEGTPIYGNLADAPEFFVNGDTYGPVSYLAYVPAALLGDDYAITAQLTNLVLSLAVGILLVLVGRRHGSLDAGVWAAASWSTCPLVAVGVSIGNNDVVVAFALMLVLLALGRPLLRGALLGIAACTKFLPALLVIPLARLRGESGRDTARFVAAGLVATLVVLFLGLRGFSTLDAFWERTVVFQLERIDIKSVWGLTGLDEVRWVFVAAAVLVAVWRLVRWRDSSHAAVAGSMAAVLALLLASLTTYWGTYVTWLVPAVLVAMLTEQVSAGRRAGALPSSSAP